MYVRRAPAVAGLFYPIDATELRQVVLDYVGDEVSVEKQPKLIIVPHAGYVYSGMVAGRAYACLMPYVSQVKKVVLIGPAHRTGAPGIFLSSANVFSTPLGDVPVDCELYSTASKIEGVKILDSAHNGEHSLEVHLPFLQTILKSFTILPLTVGSPSSEKMAEVLNSVWGGSETIIVVSSDLSHYLSYEEACAIDRVTSNAIERLDGEGIEDFQACGAYCIRGALIAAGNRGLVGKTIELCNSGDTAGPRDRVVGYGAYVFG